MNELKEIKSLTKKISKAKEKIEFYYFHIDCMNLELYLSASEDLKKKEIKRINDKINEEKALIEVTKRKIERLLTEL